MSIKKSSASNTQTRRLHSGCGGSLQSSLRDEFARGTEKVTRQDSPKVSDQRKIHRALDGNKNGSDE